MSGVTATELWRMSATELAEAIRTRHASSVEVVEAHLRRIEAVNRVAETIRSMRMAMAVPARDASLPGQRSDGPSR